MNKVKIKASGEVFEIDENTSLLEALRQKELYVKSSCGGNGSCSDCIVKIVEGADNLNDPSFAEKQLLGNVFHITKERLSCQTKITGDITIDLSQHSKGADESKRKTKTANMFKNRQKGSK